MVQPRGASRSRANAARRSASGPCAPACSASKTSADLKIHAETADCASASSTISVRPWMSGFKALAASLSMLDIHSLLHRWQATLAVEIGSSVPRRISCGPTNVPLKSLRGLLDRTKARWTQSATRCSSVRSSSPQKMQRVAAPPGAPVMQAHGRTRRAHAALLDFMSDAAARHPDLCLPIQSGDARPTGRTVCFGLAPTLRLVGARVLLCATRSTLAAGQTASLSSEAVRRRSAV